MTRSVLLVDDSAVQAATRRMILERAGYRVVVSLQPEQALETLAAHGCDQSFSLVITDHMMPSMTGAEFVTSLREVCQTIPVIVLSGLADAESQYDGLNVEFHLKPFAPDELLSTIARLVDDDEPISRTA